MIELRQRARAGRAVGVDAIGRTREARFFESVDKGTARQFFNFNGRIGQSLVAEIGRQVGGPNGIGAPPLRHGNVQDIAAGLVTLDGAARDYGYGEHKKSGLEN